MGIIECNTLERGLSTQEALSKLCVEIETVLRQFELSQKTRKTKQWLRDSLHHNSQYTTFNWLAAILVLTSSILLLYFHKYLEGTFLLFLFILNITLELYDNKLRHNEVTRRVFQIVENIRKELQSINWTPDNYPNLYCPYSPCITLQWTVRDGHLVNLPWSLLVRDDVILVRPGHLSPGYCESLEKNTEFPLLHAREVFAPTLGGADEVFTTPKARKPLQARRYRLLETPYLNNLRIYLEQSLDRPVTQYNQQRHLLMVRTLQKYLLPIVLTLAIIANTARWFYLSKVTFHVNLNFIKINSSYVAQPMPFLEYITSSVIVSSISVILPLLPPTFTLAWHFANYYGLARLQTIFESLSSFVGGDSKHSKSLEGNDLETGQNGDTTAQQLPNVKKTDAWRRCYKVFRGRCEHVCRSANVLHVLGSVTALGCVDKKGILSWPNPTAEKVFFLHNEENVSPSSSLGNVGDLTQDIDSSGGGGTPYHSATGGDASDGQMSAIAEVLDLTHTHNDPFKLHFDDQQWNKHLASLKPLGLAILLNTCNYDTQEHYSVFCSHITCEAIYNEHLVPVTNRRCLCELAKEIGFVDEAQKIFTLEHQLSTFRHLQPEMLRRDNKYARTLQMSTKLKFPFPHMFTVVVRELASGGAMQLLSEGTADIILDSCIDYWDGRDLCPLTAADRKKIQDFYQRCSLTAYCTAFAYRPLTKCISEKLSDVYLELPSDSRHLYMNHRSPTPAHWDCKTVLEPKIRANLSQFYSTDSLLFNSDLVTGNGDVSDAESCFQMQCNQIFIGMVTMQYQPLGDMVHLIEQLERACIRFVHFSKENELRSRVFSEKMGLESGWNCHISLLSERNRRDSMGNGKKRTINTLTTVPNKYNSGRRRMSQSLHKLDNPPNTNHTAKPLTTQLQQCLLIDVNCNSNNSNLESSRTMSFSAPSAINMEHSVVKFDTEHHIDVHNDSDGSEHSYAPLAGELNNATSHDWQSLSCLTDSTEHSAPINFDMSNRAKLPRGIDKIRPHIELIDNVPLLVSLFTDCTPAATREMLHIMQDYREVACIIGSLQNYDNAGIFVQADASIGVEPLYPQICQKMAAFQRTDKCIGPMELSAHLNSVPCSLSLRREDPISIYQLIMTARHYLTRFWSSIQFWLCCCVTLTFIQLAALLLMLPPIMSSGQLLWILCVAVPLLSLSLCNHPVETEVMNRPQGRFQPNLTFDVFLFMLWCYGLKFIMPFISSMVCYIALLLEYCQQTCEYLVDKENCTCALFYLPVVRQETLEGSTQLAAFNWTEDFSWAIVTARSMALLVLIGHFVVISMSFIHRDHLFHQRLPVGNVMWTCIMFFVVSIQSGYSILLYHFAYLSDDILYFTIPIWVMVFNLTSIIVTFFVTEIVKSQEIMVNQRFLRRARLDFGTKLGMNSPF